MVRTCAGSYVDGGHRWGENEIFKTLHLHFAVVHLLAAANLLFAAIYIDLRWSSLAWLYTQALRRARQAIYGASDIRA